jgi:hypothetical protein
VRASARVRFAHADANRHRRSAHHFAPGCSPGAPPRHVSRAVRHIQRARLSLASMLSPFQAAAQSKHRMHPKPANQAPQLVTCACVRTAAVKNQALAPAPRRRVVGPSSSRRRRDHRELAVPAAFSMLESGGVPPAPTAYQTARDHCAPHAPSVPVACRRQAPHVRAKTNAKAALLRHEERKHASAEQPAACTQRSREQQHRGESVRRLLMPNPANMRACRLATQRPGAQREQRTRQFCVFRFLRRRSGCCTRAQVCASVHRSRRHRSTAAGCAGNRTAA